MIGQIDKTDFSRWVMGTINSNIKRAWLAEYLVTTALDVESQSHEQWEDFDVRFGRYRIEVKSSGVITPPFPTSHLNDNPRFDIARRVAYWSYDNARRHSYPAPTRPADLYVFCIHTARSEAEFDPFDVGQWEFVSAPTLLIEQEMADAKTISWKRAKSIGAVASFHELKGQIQSQLEGPKS